MRARKRSISLLILLATAIGVLYHGALIVRPRHLLPDRPLRDDAFYALTVSRNLAHGKGLTTADGEIPTNGFQPLFTFISSLPFFFTNDRYEPLRVIHLIHLIIHLASGFMIFKLVGLLAARREACWTAFALWMISFNILKLGSNGLETGLYLFMILLSSFFYLTRVLDRGAVYDHLLFGAILGLTTLTRIDAGLLCISFAAHYSWYQVSVRREARTALSPALWFVPWLAVTAPWWIYNVRLTGSIMPVSGRSQLMPFVEGPGAVLPRMLDNLNYTVNALLDQASVAVVTPLRYIRNIRFFSLVWNLARASLLVAVMIWLRRGAVKVRPESSAVFPAKKTLFYPLYLILLLVNYNVFFRVSWYINRYTVPGIILSIALWALLLDRFRPLYRNLMIAAGIAGTLIIGGASYFTPYNSMYTEHYGWIRENAAADTWVAALQTGTLGYFHDRTINADGKVNPAIERLEPGTLGSYLAGWNVEYFIEWKEHLASPAGDFLIYYEFYDEFGRCHIYRKKAGR